MLITLKTSIHIASVAAKLKFSGAKSAVESIIGRINDLSDITEVKALEILSTLETQFKRNEARNKLKAEFSVPVDDKKKKTGKHKRDIMVIE